VTRSVTKGRASHACKNFLSHEKCLRHIVGITIVFVHAIDVKFGPPSENSSSPLVTKAGYGFAGDHLSLFTIKFFRFDIKFEWAKLMSKDLF